MARLPVAYVRGFAGGASGVNKQVDDPFYGFNDGSTHVRVEGDGDPIFYQFEGPLLRLMIDEDYRLLVRGDQRAYLLSQQDEAVLPASIWIHRFYDAAATTFSAPARQGFFHRILEEVQDRIAAPAGFDIETAARELYDFITLIKAKTGTEKVYLVAHSMGGLVARCMIQKVSQSADDEGQPRIPARDLVEKFFTYATPHGGIDFDISALDWTMEAFEPAGADIFAPDKMYGYLVKGAKWGDLAPRDWDPQAIDEETFGAGKIFCLIGTNPGDYGAPREVVGPKSDGLVKIEKAYVRKANRAFVHRSHRDGTERSTRKKGTRIHVASFSANTQFRWCCCKLAMPGVATSRDHEHLLRSALPQGRHLVDGALVLPLRHQLPRPRGDAHRTRRAG